MRRIFGTFGFALIILLSPLLLLAQQQSAENSLLTDMNAKFAHDLNAAAESHDGVMGIFVKDLTSGQHFEVNADTVFPQASSIKILLLIELMRQAQSG